MSTENDGEHLEGGDVEIESTYQPPPKKTIEEIVKADQEDESLRKYKEALLGAAQTETIVVGKYTKINDWMWKGIESHYSSMLLQFPMIHGK